MTAVKGKVAVITGAASGIGRSLAEHCLKEGMKVVLADVEKKALFLTESKIKKPGAQLTAVVTDVRKMQEVKLLAKKAIDAYEKVDLLFNNAGVGAGGTLWESTLNDCKWVIDVNLWGIIHCIREFVPIMLEQNTPCHIVNTASIAGLSTYHPSSLYHLTKHAVVALSEQLYHDLNIKRSKIKVSVLCPGFVRTNIMDAERNRPKEYFNDPSEIRQMAGPDDSIEIFREMVKNGMPPVEVSDCVFKAIHEERFLILTHPEMKPHIQARMEDILQERNPTLPPPPTEWQH